MKDCYSKFEDPSTVISTTTLGPLVVTELWHGPTGAFKDLSLSVVGRMVDFFLRKRNQRSTILVSTSGDTGSAAIHSVLGSKNIHIMVMYPRHMVSRIQQLQMTTVDAPNVHVFSVDGTSDDTDEVMTALHDDREFYKEFNINVFNSLNVCRILVQSIHFAFLYLQQCPDMDDTVTFCVPTGGMGNVSSGMFMRSLGLPLKFLLAVNENDVVHRTFQSGRYCPGPSGALPTLSSAMDITNPYNMERVWHYLALGDQKVLQNLVQEFEASKSVTLPPAIISAAGECISTASIRQERVLATMKEVWQEHQYLLCPHTSVGVTAARAHLSTPDTSGTARGKGKLVVVATATAHKFVEAIKKAGLQPPAPNKFQHLEGLPERKKVMDKGQNWPQVLKEAIRQAWQFVAVVVVVDCICLNLNEVVLRQDQQQLISRYMYILKLSR